MFKKGRKVKKTAKRFGKKLGTELQENILRPWSEKNCIEIDIDGDSKVCQG